jgi:Transposase DDE domain
MLNWRVEEKGIAQHIPGSTNRSEATAPSRVATFEMTRRTTFTTAQAGSGLARMIPCMRARHFCIAPANSTVMYAHSNPQCFPKDPSRKIPRDIHEHARDVARSFAGTEDFEKSRRERKKIEMRFAHLKRILKLGRLRLRGPRGAQDKFVLVAIAQNLRRLASLVARPPPTQALCIA